MINFSKSPSFTAEVMQAIEHYGKKIKSIILNRNPQVTDQVLTEEVFIRGGTRWTEISLLGCANITERVVYRLIHCRNLTKLNLSRCTNVKSSNALVDLVESCTNLVHLRLGNLKCVNNSVVQAIEASLAPRLISLDLSRTGSGSTLAFIRLIQHAPVLQELHVDNVEMEHLVALQSCLNIQEIHCQYLLPSILTTADRQARLDLMKKFLTVCTRMRIISVNKMDVPADLIHVILSNSPNLEELMLINSTQLNYQSISLESLPRLKHLELGSCKDIDDKTMDSLSLSCPNLEYIHIGPSTGFTSLATLPAYSH
jgi:Leucine-rich repeat (LRR) protein